MAKIALIFKMRGASGIAAIAISVALAPMPLSGHQREAVICLVNRGSPVLDTKVAWLLFCVKSKDFSCISIALFVLISVV